MKLLLDGNVSDRIVQQIVDLFPDSTHIKAIGLKEADDSIVWAWAKQEQIHDSLEGYGLLSASHCFRISSQVHLAASG